MHWSVCPSSTCHSSWGSAGLVQRSLSAEISSVSSGQSLAHSRVSSGRCSHQLFSSVSASRNVDDPPANSQGSRTSPFRSPFSGCLVEAAHLPRCRHLHHANRSRDPVYRMLPVEHAAKKAPEWGPLQESSSRAYSHCGTMSVAPRSYRQALSRLLFPGFVHSALR